MRKRVTIEVRGLVQGIGLRARCAGEANRLGLAGSVENTAQGTVRIIAEGEEQHLQRFVAWVSANPDASRVDQVAATWDNEQGLEAPFLIR